MAIKVKLRKKKITGNRQSFYLDFYPPITHPETGKPTRREFLGLYLFENTKNPIDKQHNKETEQLAEQLRQKRDIQLNKPEIYTGFEKEKLRIHELGEQNFVAYFKNLADKRKASNHDNWISAYKYLITFTKGEIKFSDLNVKFCNDFKEFLLSTKSNHRSKQNLAQNSALSYFNKLKATLKQAYKDGFLAFDLNANVEPIKQEETRRNYLTIEELNVLVKTECNNPVLKNAALFSALTGLRFSDINNLIWGEIHHNDDYGITLQFKQQKTKGIEYLPISEQAYSLLGEPQKPTDKVFDGLIYSAYSNKHLAKWIALAGISKDITFHCFRHTYATLQLYNGTDIYTVSKMLGHKDIKTTQVYVKIVDDSKRKTVDKIKLDF